MDTIEVKFLHLDGRLVTEHIIGMGGSGIVIQQEEYALKIPRLKRIVLEDGSVQSLSPKEGDYDDRPPLISTIENERAIYRRLGDHPGILPCYNLSSSDHSIQIPLMKNGDLRHYLAKTRPEREMQCSWLKQIAQTLAHTHRQRVLIADIRLDNLLLDDNFNIKLTDFGESSLMPLSWDQKGSDHDGYSIGSDIGQFGALMFEIITGQPVEFDIFEDFQEPGDPAVWPPRDSLPPTDGVWLGHIIDKCWTGQFESTEDLVAALEKEAVY